VRRLLLLLAAWFLIHSLLIVINGFRDEGRPADVALILGSKVHRGGELSSGLERRLQKGVELYRKHLVKALIVSGGLGREGFQEADVMRDYLLKQGVPDQDILVDRNGDNTRLSAIHTRRILVDRNWHSAIAVTQYYHITRAKLALREEGVQDVTGAHADYRFAITDPWSIAREWVGYYAYLVGR
jgi:vancomycin permeability regulator SanA